MPKQFSRLLMVIVATMLLSACATKTVKKAEAPKPSTKQQMPVPVLSLEQQQQFQTAVQALQSGQLDQAEQTFVILLEQFPNLAGAQVNLGLIARARGQESAALDYFEKALDSNPNNPDALVLMAVEDRRQGRFQQAQARLLQALENKPDMALAHYNLGVLYELYLQDFDEAIDHYERYVELSQSEDTATVSRWIKLLERR